MGMLLEEVTGKVGPGRGIIQVRKESSRLREHMCRLWVDRRSRWPEQSAMWRQALCKPVQVGKGQV